MNLPRPLSHAYIIAGGRAQSRRDYARRLAMAYVCSGVAAPCGVCRHCEKAAAGIHPDVIWVTPAEDKRDILADQARALRADAYIRPNEAARKVYLIDPADSLNDTAQNALLKVLEDGPPYAAFLFLCAQPGRLLTTIRSRCETLTLPPEEEAPDPRLQELAAQLADKLLTGDELELVSFLCALERDKIKTRELQDLLDLTEEALRPSLPARPARTAGLLRLVRRCRDACAFNVGPGHLLGMLWTGRGAISSTGGSAT